MAEHNWPAKIVMQGDAPTTTVEEARDALLARWTLEEIAGVYARVGVQTRWIVRGQFAAVLECRRADRVWRLVIRRDRGGPVAA